MFGKIIFISLLAFLAQHVCRLLYFRYVLGLLKTVYTHYPGNCRQVPGIENVFLFVVSHRPGQSDSIEKFLYIPEKTQVKHLKTYQGSDTMKIINDVAATSENSFYFTNCVYTFTPTLQMLEHLLLVHWGDVVYYNGLNYQSVANGIGSPNGISLSKNKQFVYVSAFFDKKVEVYKRKSDGKLFFVQAWSLDTHVDNFAVHPETGDIYLGAHPIPYKYAQHDANPRTKRSPSQVLQLKVKDENVTSVQELFVDATGDLISGSSVALVYKNKLLIGSVMHKLVLCDVNIPL